MDFIEFSKATKKNIIFAKHIKLVTAELFASMQTLQDRVFSAQEKESIESASDDVARAAVRMIDVIGMMDEGLQEAGEKHIERKRRKENDREINKKQG
jgi:hypothetical protein